MVGPYVAMLAGRWAEAVEGWQALGCPYEAALAAIDSGDGGLLEWALVELRELGAQTGGGDRRPETPGAGREGAARSSAADA